jgi:uncharacterized protein YkwD
MSPNWIDIAILVVVAWNVANAVRAGFVGAFVDLAAFLLAVTIAVISYVRVADFAVAQFNVPPLVAQPAAFAAIWLVTSVLVGTIGHFIAGPFGFLLRGSPIDLLLSVAPGAIKGFAVSSFLLMLALSPSSLPLPVPVPVVTDTLENVRTAMQESLLANELVERTSAYDRWARTQLEEPVSQTLNLLTIPAGTHERVDLNFRAESPEADPQAEERLFELLNEERRRAGLSELVREAAIDQVARAHSVDMLRRGYFAHETPEGVSAFDRMLQGGVRFRTAAENLALAPNAEIAHEGLMDSPGHRANILNPEFTRVGIGAVRVAGIGRIFTQDFAS